MNIGDKIREYRNNSYLTQGELANKTGLSKNAIWNYENNKRQPNIETVNKIAEALGITINELVDGEYLETQEFKEDFDINVFEPRVMQYINNLKEKLKNTLPDVEVNNTLVLQNIIINLMAKESAKIAAGMFEAEILNEFAVDYDKKLQTGRELYDRLYSKYYKEYRKERKESLSDMVKFIVENRIESDGLTNTEIDVLKEYYEDYHERDIPPKVLKIIKNTKRK